MTSRTQAKVLIGVCSVVFSVFGLAMLTKPALSDQRNGAILIMVALGNVVGLVSIMASKWDEPPAWIRVLRWVDWAILGLLMISWVVWVAFFPHGGGLRGLLRYLF